VHVFKHAVDSPRRSLGAEKAGGAQNLLRFGVARIFMKPSVSPFFFFKNAERTRLPSDLPTRAEGGACAGTSGLGNHGSAEPADV